MRSNATSSSSAANCVRAVLAPVPRSTFPQKIVIRSSGPMVSQQSIASLATDFGASSVAAPAEPTTPDMENPMTRMPLALRSSRRSNEVLALDVVMSTSRSGRCRTLHSGDDALMGAAAAKIVGEHRADFGFAGVLVLCEECGGSHDHAVGAISALRRLLVDESLLEL